MQRSQINWQSLWVDFSKMFLESAEKYLSEILTKQSAEESNAQLQNFINDINQQWLDLFNQYQVTPVFVNAMQEVMQQSAKKLLQIWKRRAKQNKPITSVQEFYDLWLQCGHEAYNKALRSDTFQNMYCDMMNATLKFWQTQSR